MCQFGHFFFAYHFSSNSFICFNTWLASSTYVFERVRFFTLITKKNISQESLECIRIYVQHHLLTRYLGLPQHAVIAAVRCASQGTPARNPSSIYRQHPPPGTRLLVIKNRRNKPLPSDAQHAIDGLRVEHHLAWTS